MVHKQTKATVAILVLVLLVCAYSWRSFSAAKTDVSDAVPYQILKDEMGTRIGIGVQAEIDPNQLRATLVKAAEDHQYDAARDYLFSDFLFIDAYLVSRERQSTIPAARLRRYVPPRNPSDEHHDWMDWLARVFGRNDRFYLTLEEAKRTLG